MNEQERISCRPMPLAVTTARAIASCHLMFLCRPSVYASVRDLFLPRYKVICSGAVEPGGGMAPTFQKHVFCPPPHFLPRIALSTG